MEWLIYKAAIYYTLFHIACFFICLGMISQREEMIGWYRDSKFIGFVLLALIIAPAWVLRALGKQLYLKSHKGKW